MERAYKIEELTIFLNNYFEYGFLVNKLPDENSGAVAYKRISKLIQDKHSDICKIYLAGESYGYTLEDLKNWYFFDIRTKQFEKCIIFEGGE